MNDPTADAWSADGIATTVSTGTVGQTLERLLALLDAKGLTVFTVIDHSGAAAAAGLTLRDTKVVVFGSPRAGTPVMAHRRRRRDHATGLDPSGRAGHAAPAGTGTGGAHRRDRRSGSRGGGRPRAQAELSAAQRRRRKQRADQDAAGWSGAFVGPAPRSSAPVSKKWSR
jgi:uncharacterized protein DUF302